MVDCPHSWCTKGATCRIAYTVEHWQGLVEGLLSCQNCERIALARLLAWRGSHLELRILSLAEIDPATSGVFLRNMKSDYCDLARKRAEWSALTLTATPTKIGLFQLPDMICRDSRPLSVVPHYPNWQTLSTDDPEIDVWWANFEEI